VRERERERKERERKERERRRRRGGRMERRRSLSLFSLCLLFSAPLANAPVLTCSTPSPPFPSLSPLPLLPASSS